MPAAIIIGATSDIGREIGNRLLRDGWTVTGTHRRAATEGKKLEGWKLHACDLSKADSVDKFIASAVKQDARWDLIVFAAGTEEPIGPFWECEANAWETGIHVNSLAPLRILRGLYPLRRANGSPAVAFFSGSGTNSAAPSYSAYCASKILLIKMCELLDAESPDTSFFIVGPGIVRTKIHEQTLAQPVLSGTNHRKVVEFLASKNPGTSHDDIYGCLSWCLQAGKPVVGGRNISLVYDTWRDGGKALAKELRADSNLYKLRRHGNERAITSSNA